MATDNSTAPAIVWFRRDLRLADNPALYAAVDSGRPLILVYVRETDAALSLSPGAAADWWLHHSLDALERALGRHHGEIALRTGEALALIPQLARETGAAEVFWNRLELPWIDQRDVCIARDLKSSGVRPRAFRGATLTDAERVMTKSGTPYKVFSAFWRAASRDLDPRSPLPAPTHFHWASNQPRGETLADWALCPTQPDWASGFSERWTPGEDGAVAHLDRFLDAAIADYPTDRDRPDRYGTSRLSPHLNWGEISPRTVWHRVQAQSEAGGTFKAGEKFLAELGWRDFAHYLMHHFDDLRTTNFNRAFDSYPWRNTPERIEAWQRGQTGIPMVDAGMRELWATGWMHNRVRMITASYLIKHLNVHWKTGMAWFEDTLVDADPAVNAASWQWVAGSGADASPFFRIFNPATQGEKFDPTGEYVRTWVPELAGLEDGVIHAPWTASSNALAQAGIELGKTYPEPYVDLSVGREKALAAYKDMKEEA